jgi:D-tyrosyl-tRNA(Tyr) deacylase
MKAVVQRASRAAVRVDGQIVGEIGRGLLVLLGIGKTDTDVEMDWVIAKLLALRIFPDDVGKMNRSVTDIGGSLLIVSQFTLYGVLEKGTRPSFSDAMPPAEAEKFYHEFMRRLRAATALRVEEGRFAAMMDVELVNDGPVTIIVEQASRLFPAQQHPSRTGETPVQPTPFIAFDPKTPVGIARRELPHWRQDGCTYFVTFRLAHSVPAEILRQWEQLPDKETAYQRFQEWLDQGHGDCWLRQPEISRIVESALRHFDGQRYTLGEFVIMPNHVHAIVAPLTGNALSDILHSWKSYTAHQINRFLGRTVPVWQDESFDHIIRNEHTLEQTAEYIRQNPVRAGLKEGEYRYGTGS